MAIRYWLVDSGRWTVAATSYEHQSPKHNAGQPAPVYTSMAKVETGQHEVPSVVSICSAIIWTWQINAIR
jgi:hypothetical protein